MMLPSISDKFGREFFDQIIEWISENLDPEDVFNEDDLIEWALSGEFIHKDDVE